MANEGGNLPLASTTTIGWRQRVNTADPCAQTEDTVYSIRPSRSFYPTWPNQAAREAETVTVADLDKAGTQTHIDEFFQLTSVAPVVWQQVADPTAAAPWPFELVRRNLERRSRIVPSRLPQAKTPITPAKAPSAYTLTSTATRRLLGTSPVRSATRVWIFGALALGAGACSSSAAPALVPECPAAKDGPSSPATPNSDVPYDMKQGKRKSCTFGPGDTVDTTVGTIPPMMPLKHVVLLMMENRSFDHYFSGLSNVDAHHGDTNPDPSYLNDPGHPVPQTKANTVCENGPSHEWGPSHLQFDNGKMDGFVAVGGATAMSYYTEIDIPYYYWLARTFAISDRHFSSLLGPTWPNRLFTVAATSCGFAEGDDTNPLISTNCGAVAPNLFNQLDQAGASYTVFDDGQTPYIGSVPMLSSLFFDIFALNDPTKFATFDDFVSQAGSNSLPDVSVIEPNYQSWAHIVGGTPNDDHPPADIQLGQQFVYSAVTALMSKMETWSSSAMFITYDENGGYYDHVVPPAACPPEDNMPVSDYAFNRLGFRVPLIVVSPYVKRGYVSHYVTDHTSILRFIQAWKNRGALTKRDANAWPMLDIFDFNQTPTAPPKPTGHTPLAPDPTKESQCPNP
jgi:phospholipase C